MWGKYICRILYTAIRTYVLYSYSFCVLQIYTSLNKIWELTENGGVNPENSVSLFIKILVESSKRKANSAIAKTNGTEGILMCDEKDQGDTGSQPELQILS